MYRWALPASICLTLVLAGCGEPPNKEMDQAQGAIDAARAAGADRYAVGEYAAATDALTRAHQAVTERDFRLALNDALESREHAQNAAREAADTKARLHGEVERLVTEVTLSLNQADRALASAQKARPTARRALQEHQVAVAAATTDLQKARAAVTAGDYAGATSALTGTKERIATLLVALDALSTVQTPRRRR